MALSFAHGSGMAIITAKGRSIPLITKNSKVLSSMAESEPVLLIAGRTLCICPFKYSDSIFSSRASILSALPRMVLISPLCTISRLGWARSQLGLVLVEKRECTMAMADSKSLLCKSAKKVLSCPTRNIPLYTMVRLENDTT